MIHPKPSEPGYHCSLVGPTLQNDGGAKRGSKDQALNCPRSWGDQGRCQTRVQDKPVVESTRGPRATRQAPAHQLFCTQPPAKTYVSPEEVLTLLFIHSTISSASPTHTTHVVAARTRTIFVWRGARCCQIHGGEAALAVPRAAPAACGGDDSADEPEGPGAAAAGARRHGGAGPPAAPPHRRLHRATPREDRAPQGALRARRRDDDDESWLLPCRR